MDVMHAPSCADDVHRYESTPSLSSRGGECGDYSLERRRVIMGSAASAVVTFLPAPVLAGAARAVLIMKLAVQGGRSHNFLSVILFTFVNLATCLLHSAPAVAAACLAELCQVNCRAWARLRGVSQRTRGVSVGAACYVGADRCVAA